MIEIRCTSPAEIDAIWRALCHVPAEDFIAAEVWLGDEFWAQVVRTEAGDQTTAPAAGPQA